MNRNIKIIIFTIIIIITISLICGLSFKNKSRIKNSNKLRIVTTTFSTYDFVRQIVGDKVEVIFLLGPGVDSHSYEPSAQDLIEIKNADMFIYIGGEMEKWVDKVLDSGNIDQQESVLIKVTDCVDVIDEVEVDGAEDTEEDEEEEEEEGAFDEHIWTSPSNSIKMMKYLNEKISEIDNENRDFYERNTKKYISEIENVQAKIKEIVDNKKRGKLVFGDKMPMQYFLNEYGLTASAAFNGCSTETEPSAKTITYLVNIVKNENIPAVLYIELSTGKTAKSIANETGVEAMQIQSLHNVSKEDFDNGETYVSLMKRNIEVLKKALL